MDQDIRWRQRFEHFDRAVLLLHEPFERGLATLSALEKEGTIQRFEIAVELSWKTLKDYLEAEGVVIEAQTPRNVLKEAFAARILKDGQVWIDMLDHRNLLSHTYDAAVVESALVAIRDRYAGAIGDLHGWLRGRMEA